MTTRRQILQSAAAVGLGAPWLAKAAPYKPEYRVSMVTGPGTVWYKGGERFAALVNERTQGRIVMKLYPGSMLVQGQQDREVTALRQGVIDVLVGSTIAWAGSVKDFAVFHLPYLMPDSKAVDAVLASDALKVDFYAIMRRSGLEPLASAEYGFFHLCNTKRRLAMPDDLKGLKMRTVGSPMTQEMMTAYGANPTTMSFAEVVPAISTGAVDGLMLTGEQFIAAEAQKLGLKHVTRWRAHNELNHICIGNNVWKSWSPQDQEIARAAAKEAAAEMTAGLRKIEATEVEVMKSRGVEVVDLSPEQFAAWRVPARKVFVRWKALTNPELVTKVEQVVAASAKP